jgi:ABC-type transport system substrate-binding protein
MTEPEEVRMLFERDGLDILDLDDLNNSAEFFLHGDIYQPRLHPVQRIAITYIALNESVKPLDDVRVRKALQMSLNRNMLLDAVYGGRGTVENGIYPHGLYGFNPELPEIPYDPEGAVALLKEAGYPGGFELSFGVKSSSTQWEMALATLAVSMWEKIGVRASIRMMDESEFMRLRKSGELPCYTAMWTADFNDPDNFIYTFFGSPANTAFRSLCYPREEIMNRVGAARSILSEEERLAEYRELEKIIVQEDAAWIPLFSRLHYYVAGERLGGFRSSWNGSVKNNYRYMSVDKK